MNGAEQPAERTEQVDALARRLWRAVPELGIPEIAVAAVGGYGRSELFPYSDIDLLFVLPGERWREQIREPLALFLRTLWDAGLRVSQSVHTIEECLDVDDRNIELSVSLLDRRYLMGNRALYDKLRDAPRDRLAPQIARLTRDRHRKFGDTIYHLEPNIKEAPGTLRDMQVVRWLGRWDGQTAQTPESKLLFRMRWLLHEKARRDQNVLSFAMQDEATPRLGFAEPAEMMRAYYREAAPIRRACLRRLDEAESRRSPLFAAFRERAARLSNADFSVVGSRVYFRVPPGDPELPGRLFEFVARHGIPLARDTEARVAAAESAGMSWKQLRAILDLRHADLALRAMHDTGYLTKLFPELNGIESLVVRDFYHRYTVDEHTLVAIENAVKLRNREGAQFGELAEETPDYALLLLALLFHDAGKGLESGNHAEASMEMARRAFDDLKLNEGESETTLFLIGRHLEMSRLMLTRDLSDPLTAAALAGTVGTMERLKLLALLTYCDISAVNPTALTPWRTTLLWRLYAATARHLTNALNEPADEEGMPARYGLTHSKEEREEHRRMEAEGRTVRMDREGSEYRLTVVATDRPFLFARIAGALASFGMNILRAESFTNERRFALETFTFTDPMRTLELNPSEFERLETFVREAVEGRGDVEQRLTRRPGRKPGDGRPAMASLVSFDNGASLRATLFEITAEDRPGLLYDLARSFSAAGCNIEVVLVDTEGRKAIDVFYLTRQNRQLDEEAAVELRETIAGKLRDA